MTPREHVTRLATIGLLFHAVGMLTVGYAAGALLDLCTPKLPDTCLRPAELKLGGYPLLGGLLGLLCAIPAWTGARRPKPPVVRGRVRRATVRCRGAAVRDRDQPLGDVGASFVVRSAVESWLPKRFRDGRDRFA